MKKGFTLIELLAVIVILAIVALIAVPNIIKIINNAEEDTNTQTVLGLERAGKEYFAFYPEKLNKKEEVSMETLKALEFIDSIPASSCGKVYVTTNPNTNEYQVSALFAVKDGKYYKVYCSNLNDGKCSQEVTTENPCLID